MTDSTFAGVLRRALSDGWTGTDPSEGSRNGRGGAGGATA